MAIPGSVGLASSNGSAAVARVWLLMPPEGVRTGMHPIWQRSATMDPDIYSTVDARARFSDLPGHGRQEGLLPLATMRPPRLPSALIHWMVLPEVYAITAPSGDQAGSGNPPAAASRIIPEPSAFITDTALELQKLYAQGQVANAMRLPSGDQAGS